MEKTKRLSKSSIAVIVLSILLVLSMVMGLTGAWFTDTSDRNSDVLIQMGAVEIDATGSDAVHYGSKNGAATVELLVDLDTYEINYGVDNKSTVDIWYAITSMGVKVYEAKQVSEEWVKDDTKENSTYEGYFYVMAEKSSPASTEGLYVKDGEHFFKAASGEVDSEVTYYEKKALSTFTDAGTPHKLEGGADVDNTKVYLMFDSNGAANAANAGALPRFVVEVTVEVGAVQAAHVTAEEAAARIAAATPITVGA